MRFCGNEFPFRKSRCTLNEVIISRQISGTLQENIFVFSVGPLIASGTDHQSLARAVSSPVDLR